MAELSMISGAQNTVQGRLTTNKNLPEGWREKVEEGAKSSPIQ